MTPEFVRLAISIDFAVKVTKKMLKKWKKRGL